VDILLFVVVELELEVRLFKGGDIELDDFVSL